MLRAVLREALAVGRAAALWAPGSVDRVCDLLAARTDLGGGRVPVVLLHGLWGNRSSLLTLERALVAAGFDPRSVGYRTRGRTAAQAAYEVGAALRAVARETPAGHVHVVAHSLGGLVLREAALDPATAARLGAAVTLGAPHGGTPWARLPGWGSAAADLAPGSAWLRGLDRRTVTAPPVAWHAVFSRSDQVVPGDRGRFDHPAAGAANTEVPGVGHLGLVVDPAVLAHVVQVLRAHDARAVAA